MVTGSNVRERMKRVFTENFSVDNIAEPLASFDADASAESTLAIMKEDVYRVAGVRVRGVIAGYICQEDLKTGCCGNVLRPFDPDDVIPETLGFPDMLSLLTERRQLFVSQLGHVGGIVTQTDLQKPPMRMWLFGVITIIEMGLTGLIEKRFTESEWQALLSEKRLEKAKTLLEERRRRKQNVQLLDCLQFSEKGQIVMRTPELREQLQIQSRRRGEETVKRLEELRNNLAHAQELSNWEGIVQLAENLDKVLLF